MTAPLGAHDDRVLWREGRRRRIVGRAHSWTASLLLAAILAMVNYLAFRHYERWDWTSDERFTLSDRTAKLLSHLKEPVHIYLFLSPSERNAPDVHEVLTRYSADSAYVKVRTIDLDRQPAEYRRLAERFDIGLMKYGDTVSPEVAAVVTSGGKTWKVTRDDLLEFVDESASGEQPKTSIKIERAISGAIVQVTSGRPTRVCLTEGHGEWQLGGEGDRTLLVLRDELRRENFEIETFQTFGARTVPSRCDVVLVVGPRRAFVKEETELLLRYLEHGGNLLLALDPVIENTRVHPSGLELLGGEVGIEIDPSVVFEADEARLMPSNPVATFFVVPEYEPHRTSEALLSKGGGRSVFLEARSVRTKKGGGAATLLETSAKGFSKIDLTGLEASEGSVTPSEGDAKGPIPFAVASVHPSRTKSGGASSSKGGRIIVVGDSDWLAPIFLSAPASWANLDLASAWLGWLTERETLISIAPRSTNAAALHMTEEDLDSLLFRLLVLLPGTAALLGIGVWWTRRR